MKTQAILLFALVCAFLSVLLKKYKSEYAILISFCACSLIFLELLSPLDDLFEFLKSFENENISENVKILIKALLISVISSFVSDICLDAGEKALSGRVELFGKITVLSVSLPLFLKLYETILNILGV